MNYVLPRGLSVTSKGELVALGSWGCTQDNGTLLVYKGIQGNGKPTFSSTFHGQVWAVDARTSSGGKEAYLAAASWESQKSNFPSQTTLFHAVLS